MSSPEDKERTARPVSVSNFADFFNKLLTGSEENKCQATTTDKQTTLELQEEVIGLTFEKQVGRTQDFKIYYGRNSRGKTGLFIRDVQPQSALAGAMKPEDQLLKINEEDIKNSESGYVNHILDNSSGTIRLEVLRTATVEPEAFEGAMSTSESFEKLQQTSDKGNNECRSVSDLKERFEILIEIEKPPVSSIDAPASVQPGKIATGDPEPFEGAISTNESLESVLKNPAVSSIDAHASIQPAGITATTNREPLRARVSRSQSFQGNAKKRRPPIFPKTRRNLLSDSNGSANPVDQNITEKKDEPGISGEQKTEERVIEIGSQDRGLGPEIQQVERHKEETIDVTSKMQPVMLDENIDLTEIELFQDMHITDLTSENQYLQEGNARVTTDMKQEEDINLHAEIERLKEENSNLIAEMQRHIAENDDIKKENSNLETINKLLQEDNTTFQQMNLPPMLGLQLRGLQFLEMKRLEQEKSNLVKQVQELREEKIEKSNETRQLTDDNSNTKNEIWKVRQENHQLQQQKSEFDNKNQKLQKEKSQLDDENQQLRQEKDQTDNENQQLRQEKDQLVNENKQLRQGKNQLDNENLQLRQDKSQLDNDNQQLRQDKSQLENDIQQLRQDKSQLDNENQQLHRETAEISIELRKIRQENNNMQIEIGQYRADTMPSIITESGSVVVSNDLLGKGAWGAVWAGDFFGTKVAVKEYYEIILSPHNLNLLQREINIASYCRHPNLLQFICATKNHQNHLLIVTELMDKALRALVEQHASERSRLEYQEIKLISVDVARGLNYLHSKKPKPIIHRDISSANVLLSTENGAVRRAKISDYGSAKFMEKCNTANPGSAIYAAPEANQAKQDPKIDVFSYGFLVCEMCICQLPHSEQIIRRGQIKRIPNADIKRLVENCTGIEPQERPTMQDVIQFWSDHE